MLQICHRLPDQQFEEPPFEEAILTFLRELGHSGEIKVITDVNVNKLHQPWRSFEAVINKCLSGKETKDAKRSNEMYYPRFTKVIVNFFMTKDQSIPRRNKVNWHFARDDHMFTTINLVSRHEDTQMYGAILPDVLTNEAIKDSKSYKEYYAIASGAEPPKTKASVKKKQVRSDKTKTPPTTKGKRLKTSAKAAKPAKKKQPAKTSKAKGLTVLSEVALTEAEQMKLATKRSLIQTHSSHASGSAISWNFSEEDDDDEVNMSEDDDDDDNDDDNDNDDNDDNDDDDDNDHDDDDADNQDKDGQDNEDQDDVNEQTDSDNDGDDFVHPKFSTQDQEVRHKEEESDEEIKGASVEEEEMDEEAANEEDEGTQVTEDTHVIITAPVNPEGQQQSSSASSGFVSNMLNPSPDTGFDSIFNINTNLTSLVDVPVTTIVETPLSSATTLPPPPTPLISHLQQTPAPTPTTVPSSSLQDLLNFGSLFGFDHRLKTLEDDFSEFKQTNQFAVTFSLILGIVDAYLANKMNEAVKTAVQIQSDRLREEAQAENEDFINKVDDNIKKIIKEQVKEQVKAQVSKILPKIEKTVNEQLEAEVMTRSSNESKTSHAVAANLSELELKKILIDKMESNKSIHISD
ncbi:hypothetical protein Tco_1384138 [Tanacetum coccineum]